jgi:hypothetical protein
MERDPLRQHGRLLCRGLEAHAPDLSGRRSDERAVPLEHRQAGVLRGLQPLSGVLSRRLVPRLLGFSSYSWGVHHGGWVPLLKGSSGSRTCCRGSRPGPSWRWKRAATPRGDKADWIRTGDRAVYTELPQISAIVYLDIDLRSIGHPDWRLGSPSGALAACAEIVALPEFGGRLPGP